MIKFININNELPYTLFKKKYIEALDAKQKNIEAISISSYDKNKQEVDSRFVNLKFIQDDKFIFFSNYNSPKSHAFSSHNQISGLFFWTSTNVQIRIKAKIKKTSSKFNQDYFQKRSLEKNALAICSMQSEPTNSYQCILDKYNKTYKEGNLSTCPEHWGGFSFIPFYFEFWKGHESRINKRLVFKKINDHWKKLIIQP